MQGKKSKQTMTKVIKHLIWNKKLTRNDLYVDEHTADQSHLFWA